ncbi:c-type cytochrome [Henriciella aquimarina]|uniref:c-type cytochrome n=1 Tax=Henriciella aquimarina TaxID=545261 RepID=UPI0009FF0205|nr:cytochrome c [Henriciella aquimarina]
MKIQTLGLASLCVILASCGGADTESAEYRGDEELPNGMTISEMIETRQDGLEDVGGSFKTISDELKKGDPNVADIQTAAANVEAHSQEIGDWFPEGTGADSGVETEALDSIWEDPEGFEAAITKFETAAGELNTAAQSGDVEAIQAAFETAGGTCKNCHDSYRADDD